MPTDVEGIDTGSFPYIAHRWYQKKGVTRMVWVTKDPDHPNDPDKRKETSSVTSD
jgi:hypothetical protein